VPVRSLWFSVLVLVVIGSDACGATDSKGLEFPSTVQTTKMVIKKKRPAPSIREKSGFSLILPSFVIHGIKPDSSVTSEMSRKLDADGRSVLTPGLGLSYEGKENGLLALVAGVKDCYDNLAGMLQIGQAFQVNASTSWGYTLGVYARETPMSCQTVTTYQSVNGGPGRPAAMQVSSGVQCTEFDNYPWKSVVYINGESVDIIPMPFLHFSTALYKSRDFQIDLKLMTNYALNEIGFGIPF
jgi:hypothetical protein